MLFDFHFSAQGHNHVKAGKVCQDYSGSYSDDRMTIAVVADGHGSDNYPRTDRGSYFATQAALHAIREFVTTVENSGIDLSLCHESNLEQLAKNILYLWHDHVEEDVAQHPFSEEELSKVSAKYKKRYLSDERVEKAYGTTLIATCQTEKYWFGLQIGDGKCVCIMQDGVICEPIPWDEDCQSNVTTSICDSDAIDEFRYFFTTNPPVATFMGSDGIDDSYASPQELHDLYSSILTIFAEHGVEVGVKEVSEFLPVLSQKGSGDDVSVAGILSMPLSAAFINLLKAQCEYAEATASRERHERDVMVAHETLEYVAQALEKARVAYELAAQKSSEAEHNLSRARVSLNQANERLQRATIDLGIAKKAYENELLNIAETTSCCEADCPAVAEENAVVDQESTASLEIEPATGVDGVNEPQNDT